MVRYEDLHKDRATVLRRVASHLGMMVSEGEISRVLADTAFDAMKAVESKFDHATALLLERGMTPSAFLRHGRIGEGVGALAENQRAAFEARWRDATGISLRELHLSAFLH